uniref:helix-turn-helix domain-containing protein n=1 Tax=Streptococcus lutetiensis TaxID=150055 RepID=UPI001F05C9B6
TRARVCAHACHTGMSSTRVDTVSAALGALLGRATSTDPAERLRAMRALQRLQERLEAIHVTNARDNGWSWQDIATALGVSRQAVHKMYNRRK